MRLRRWTAAALVAVLGACSLQTATAPTGSLTLYAEFEDAQDLVPGHNVQISNIVAGSVREVSLEGYVARVRLSIQDGHRIPEGTTAIVRRTSLLGEHFVDLVLPEDFDPGAADYLASGDEIERTQTQADIEQLAQQASVIVGAVTADDLAVSVQAGADGLGGRGATLNRAVKDAALVVGALADQRGELGAAIDGLARLGATLAPASDRLATVIGELATATGQVGSSRTGIVRAVDALVALAAATNEVVLEPHLEQLRTMLGQLDPLLGSLAGQSDVLELLITDLLRFTEAFPTALHKGTVLLLAWAFVEPPSRAAAGLDGDPLAAVARAVGGAP